MTFNELDHSKGQSGLPVWLRWNDSRNLVAVLTSAQRDLTPPYQDIVANRGARITGGVVEQLKEWMRLDNVSANF
jgi:hypothetical protein